MLPWRQIYPWSTLSPPFPFQLSVMIAIPGVILSLLGKYIPTIVLAYVVGERNYEHCLKLNTMPFS